MVPASFVMMQLFSSVRCSCVVFNLIRRVIRRVIITLAHYISYSGWSADHAHGGVFKRDAWRRMVFFRSAVCLIWWSFNRHEWSQPYISLGRTCYPLPSMSIGRHHSGGQASRPCSRSTPSKYSQLHAAVEYVQIFYVGADAVRT